MLLRLRRARSELPIPCLQTTWLAGLHQAVSIVRQSPLPSQQAHEPRVERHGPPRTPSTLLRGCHLAKRRGQVLMRYPDRTRCGQGPGALRNLLRLRHSVVPVRHPTPPRGVSWTLVACPPSRTWAGHHDRLWTCPMCRRMGCSEPPRSSTSTRRASATSTRGTWARSLPRDSHDRLHSRGDNPRPARKPFAMDANEKMGRLAARAGQVTDNANALRTTRVRDFVALCRQTRSRVLENLIWHRGHATSARGSARPTR
jgi:hypothetical protein